MKIFVIEITVPNSLQTGDGWNYVYGEAYTSKKKAEKQAEIIEAGDSEIYCTVKEIILVK